MNIKRTIIASIAAAITTTAAAQFNSPAPTYVFDKPYKVEKIAPPKGKKVKNVILMIGDGMSLAHMYTAWTANRGQLWLENAQYTGLSKTWCTNRLVCRHSTRHMTEDLLPRRRHRPTGQSAHHTLRPRQSKGQECRHCRDLPSVGRHPLRLLMPQPRPRQRAGTHRRLSHQRS